MNDKKIEQFNTKTFLATVEDGRSIIRRKPKQNYYAQGAPADAVYYLKRGRAKLTVISKRGKEATVTMLAVGDFFGEESISGVETSHSC
jgi:CRP/FNR family cyclic AMP-dependent transcriptional regulator